MVFARDLETLSGNQVFSRLPGLSKNTCQP
jgi:hypothetical protein